jgi:hypothetical protein
MDMDRFLSDGNIDRLRQLATDRITSTERMALLEALEEHFVNAQNLGRYARLARTATTLAERDLQLELLAREESKRTTLESE